MIMGETERLRRETASRLVDKLMEGEEVWDADFIYAEDILGAILKEQDKKEKGDKL